MGKTVIAVVFHGVFGFLACEHFEGLKEPSLELELSLFSSKAGYVDGLGFHFYFTFKL